MADWIYKNVPINFDVSSYFGFTYRITNLINDRQYIGRKYLWSFRRSRITGRRKKQPSNWKTYYGSCDELKNDIKALGKHLFKREILEFHTTKAMTNYEETRLLFVYDVLCAKMPNGQFRFYNANILGRYYRGHIE